MKIAKQRMSPMLTRLSKEGVITHVTPVGRNVFDDLGFEPGEAAKLLAETDAIISKNFRLYAF